MGLTPMTIFISNINYDATEADLQALFDAAGYVASGVRLCLDEEGNSKGFGFAEIGDDTSAESAISTLDGRSLMGRRVNLQKSRSQGARHDRRPKRRDAMAGSR